MPIQRTTWIDDDGTGTTGSLINNAWLQSLYDQIDGAVGQRTDVAYSTSWFGAEAGAWVVQAGDQLTYAYTKSGKLAIVTITLVGTELTTSGTSAFRVYLPGLVVAKDATFAMPYYIGFSNTSGIGVAVVTAGSGYLRILRDIGGTPWPVGVNYYHYINAALWIE